MENHTLYDAKAHFSALVDRVHGGEVVVVTKHGRPWVQIAPLPPDGPRRGGDFAGRIHGDIAGGIGKDDGAWG